jgi:hypothetical protein
VHSLEQKREITSSLEEKTGDLKPSAKNTLLCPGIIYFTPKNSRSDEFLQFAEVVDTKLRKHCGWKQQGTSAGEGATPRTKKMFSIPDDFEPLVAAVPDMKPLLQINYRSNKILEEGFHASEPNRPNTIIAIIYSRGRTKAEIQHIQAEVHKFGERRIGAVTYCATRSTLETTLNESETIHKAKGIENSFPQGILEKLNLMHGGQNYESDPLKGVMLGTTPLDTATPIMICGAHITHPGSDAANHCPSVAAVVASVDSC